MRNLITEEHASLTRPYEKCAAFGAQSLTDAELLAVIIRTGRRGQSAVKLAEAVLHLPPDGTGLTGLPKLTAAELMQIPGIGRIKAMELMCVSELSRRMAAYRARKTLVPDSPETIAGYYMEQLRHESQENVICMMIDARGQVIGDEVITRGTVNASRLSTRDLFMTAMRYRAVMIVLIHNHPSGDPSPSEADRLITEKAAKAGELLDIRLCDHIIIGDGRYVSFLEAGLLNAME